jgi:hypothetical protein
MSDAIASRPSCRCVRSPRVVAAGDLCRTDCSWGTASPPPRSRTRTYHPMGDCRAPRRPNRCPGSGRISSPSPAPGCSARACGSAVPATRHELRELLLPHCASGKGSEYVTCCAAVRRECLRRWQLPFIGPPASVQFYELPSLFSLASRRGSDTPFGHLVQSSSASRFTADGARASVR